MFVSTEDIKAFIKEIALLGNKPVLIALGDKVYNALVGYLNDEFKIIKIKHFSCYISKEAYRENILRELSNL